jgi:hypothetical protein
MKLWAMQRAGILPSYQFSLDLHAEVFEACAYHRWGLFDQEPHALGTDAFSDSFDSQPASKPTKPTKPASALTRLFFASMILLARLIAGSACTARGKRCRRRERRRLQTAPAGTDRDSGSGLGSKPRSTLQERPLSAALVAQHRQRDAWLRGDSRDVRSWC